MTHSDKTDEQIVLLVKAGDIESFRELVDRYEAKLKRYSRKFLFDRSDTDDLVQDVFIKAYTNIQSFDNSKIFSPWIYRIAHNEFVNALKKKLSSRIFSLDLDTFFPQPVARETADDFSEKEFTSKLLDKHLKEIDPKYREPMILYFFEDMDYREISQVLEIPVSTVGVRIKRGKDKLREILKDNNFVYEK